MTSKRRQTTVGAVLLIALAILCLLFVSCTQWGLGISVTEVRKLDVATTTTDAETLDATTAAAARQEVIPSAGISTRLRFNWTDMAVSSPMAHYWHAHQRSCGLRRADFQFRNFFGLGHELHMWAQALCNAAEAGVRIRTALPWSYRDAEACRRYGDDPSSALECYFSAAEPDCPNDQYGGDGTTMAVVGRGRELDPSDWLLFYSPHRKSCIVQRLCDNVMKKFNATVSDVRASAIEYLFAGTSQVVIDEAHRQLSILFGGIDVDSFSRLITVHIRWGDKKAEVDLLSVDEYVRAVQTLLAESQAEQSGREGKVGIYLSTEDPLAVELFRKEAKKYGWTVFVDVYLQEFSSVRDGNYNGNPRMAKKMKGRPGLVALASLLVAMQADDFVLTTTSNWSVLMNELRTNVLDPRCNQCTRMIDLLPGDW